RQDQGAPRSHRQERRQCRRAFSERSAGDALRRQGTSPDLRRGLARRGARADRRRRRGLAAADAARRPELIWPMSSDTFSSWQIWAVLSAVFAALTAIFAKVGVEDINADLATLIRTVIVLVTLALILFATGKFSEAGPIS